MTAQANRVYRLPDADRALGLTVVVGGNRPWAMSEDALPHCDAVCTEDAESTPPHLIADWEHGPRRNRREGPRDPTVPIVTPATPYRTACG